MMKCSPLSYLLESGNIFQKELCIVSIFLNYIELFIGEAVFLLKDLLRNLKLTYIMKIPRISASLTADAATPAECIAVYELLKSMILDMNFDISIA